MSTSSGSSRRQPPVTGGRTAGPDPAEHVNNGEENIYPGYVACYSKGLPHDDTGEVDPEAYRRLLRAVNSADPADFESVPLDPAGARKLTNPQGGLASNADGIDTTSFTAPPAPRLDSPENSGDMAELYWMALTRDVPFDQFDTDPLVASAAADLSRMSDFRGPKENGVVTTRTLFRGDTPQDRIGPYISQFLLRDVQFGTHHYPQRQDTVQPGRDYVTTFPTWLAVQRGLSRGLAPGDRNRTETRYLRTPRDLSHYVHFDADASPFQPFLNAGLILLRDRAPLDANLPYHWSSNQDGFATFGMPHLFDLVTSVAARALRTTWWQKWYVHRRLRPEAVGGRVHAHLTGLHRYDFLDRELLESEAVQRVFDRNQSHLLPQAYPEGAPTHPSYTAGHATVAAAAATVLKAWFDETAPLADPVQADATGTALVPYEGADAGQLTVGGELNKLAANIAVGRNIAGVHYRSDYSASSRLGEALAIEILRRQKSWFNEDHSLTLTRFDGTSVTI
ncbi:vanadium-dependent haloperoxidase [Micromonospora tulbaghiae]|uniref:vanadium-dependent haloperoxidase n=1 Tax=Micromonospora TaxID=1873 RepID=UPI00332AED4A